MFRHQLPLPLLFAGLLVAGCSADTEGGRARDAAGETLDAFAAGEYAKAWDGLDEASQAAVTREEWVRLYTVLCVPDAEGVRFKVQHVQVEGKHAAVRVSRQGMIFTWPMVKEPRGWRLQLEAGQLHDFQTFPVEELATEWRASGLCRQREVDAPDVEVIIPVIPLPPRATLSASARASVPAIIKPAPKAPAPAAPAAPAKPAPVVKPRVR